MTENEKQEYHYNHHWRSTIGIILATLLGSFFAFYFIVDTTLNRMTDPAYNMRKMEKIMRQQERSFHKFENKMLDNPFEPKMAPMLVNLVKESDEYKVIVDLKPLDGNEKNIDIRLNDNVLTVSGEMGKIERRGEKIMNFTQSFALDENLDASKITKEKRGNKYIITIPFKD